MTRCMALSPGYRLGGERELLRRRWNGAFGEYLKGIVVFFSVSKTADMFWCDVNDELATAAPPTCMRLRDNSSLLLFSDAFSICVLSLNGLRGFA